MTFRLTCIEKVADSNIILYSIRKKEVGVFGRLIEDKSYQIIFQFLDVINPFPG